MPYVEPYVELLVYILKTFGPVARGWALCKGLIPCEGQPQDLASTAGSGPKVKPWPMDPQLEPRPRADGGRVAQKGPKAFRTWSEDNFV